MDYTILSTLLLALTLTVNAQISETHLPKYYLQLGTGPASNNGAFAEFSGFVVFHNKWTASLSYQDFDMDPPDLPSDYRQGYSIVIVFPVPDAMPTVALKSVNLTAGRFVPLGRKTWITAEAGLAFVSGHKFTFAPQPIVEETFYVTSNYAVQKETVSGAGGIIKTGFTWAFVPYVGIGVSAFANINSVQSSLGLEFKVVAGWLNTKRSKSS